METVGISNFVSGVLVAVVAGLLLAGILALFGAPRLIAWIRQRKIDASPTPKLRILLAKLDGDTAADSTQQTVRECIDRELGDGVAVLAWPTVLRLGDGDRERAEAEALRTAQAWLRGKNADLLIWGRLRSPHVISLRFTAAERNNTEPQNYVLTPDTLDLPTTFISDLGVTIAAYATAAVKNAYDTKTYVVPTLQSLIYRIEALLNAPNPNFTEDTVATLSHCCARGKICLYEFLGDERDLRSSVDLNYRALALRGRKDFPEEWARIQNTLGVCLGRLAERTGVAAYFDEAVSAFKAALLERTEEKSFVQNAIIKMNLASIFMRRAERESTTENLETAVGIFDEIAVPRLRDENPDIYAITQNNRGLAWMALGQRRIGTEGLHKSLQAFEEALEIRRKELAPFDWAFTKLNLGTALVTMGERTSMITLLQSAVHELQDSLEVFDQSRTPRYWAFAQCNLGAALVTIGLGQEDENILRSAISAAKNSLEIIKQDSDPVVWNSAQLTLGRAHAFLGHITEDVSLLKRSLISFREVLAQPSILSSFRQTAGALNEYGLALSYLGDFDVGYLDQAATAFADSRAKSPRETMPGEWARATLNLGRVLRLKGSEDKDSALLEQAIETLSERLKVYSDDSNRGHAALAYFELAQSYLALARLEGGGGFLPRCRDACHKGLKLFDIEPNNAFVAEFENLLTQADELDREPVPEGGSADSVA